MAGIAPGPEAVVDKWLTRVAAVVAAVGGVILAGLALMTVASIIGRVLVPLGVGLGPVPGDFELVEIGCAIAIATFLPWCQLKRGHVTVDILVDRFPPPVKGALTLAGNIVMTVAAALMARQLWIAAGEKFQYSETTMILQVPLGYGYMISAIGVAFFAVVCLFTVWRSLNETLAAAAEGKPVP